MRNTTWVWLLLLATVAGACTSTATPEASGSPASTVSSTATAPMATPTATVPTSAAPSPSPPPVSSTVGPVPDTPVGPDIAGELALLDITQVGTGTTEQGFFTEGAYSFIQVFGADGAPISGNVFTDLVVATLIPVAVGPIRVVAFQRGCVAVCPGTGNLDVLDPPRITCDSEIDAGASEIVRLVVDARSCSIHIVRVPFATPSRCLPDELEIDISSQETDEGGTGIVVVVTSEADEPCEVATDIRMEVIGAGNQLDSDQNPQDAQLGPYTLFPRHSLAIETEWKNSCGDYAAPTLTLASELSGQQIFRSTGFRPIREVSNRLPPAASQGRL